MHLAQVLTASQRQNSENPGILTPCQPLVNLWFSGSPSLASTSHKRAPLFLGTARNLRPITEEQAHARQPAQDLWREAGRTPFFYFPALVNLLGQAGVILVI